jgi:hypothetical protein
VVEVASNKVDGKPLEIWFADEARIGRKDRIVRRWAGRGTRLSAPRDLRMESTYIFGAICRPQRKGTSQVLPRCIWPKPRRLWLQEFVQYCCSRRAGTSRAS